MPPRWLQRDLTLLLLSVTLIILFTLICLQRVSQVLWAQLDTERREHHVSCVELFYRLHCLAPSASICEDIICLGLLSEDKVSGKPHLIHLHTEHSIETFFKKCVYVCLCKVVCLEALHRFSVLWHLTREIQTNRSTSLNRSFDRSYTT